MAHPRSHSSSWSQRPGFRPSESPTRLGIDGIGLVLIALSTTLVPVVILAGWRDVEQTPIPGAA
jgi:NADH:ubiquinone oxidoreductase subunit 4 (subunit M)